MNEQRSNFNSMKESTKADWDIIVTRHQPYAAELADRVMSHLKMLGDDNGGFAVTRLQHSLLTATLAHKSGEDEEYVVCALLHDIGDTLGSWNHPDVSAAIVKPFVSEANHWMVEKHGIFQGYFFFEHIGLDPNMREQFRGHPHFERTARFCEIYDNPAFNPKLECAPLEFFAPMVQRVFEKPKNSIYKDTCHAK
ncbi:MAG TPA: HD domain-containing protein [Burkholderiales bacterium]|nr:HD domain-containing protein [Burkholderiales bacterium]